MLSLENSANSQNDESTYLPLVSVITVVKNAVTHIERCINSVLKQEYPNIEHVIIDALSNDGTVDILKNYSDKLGFWISEKDNGIYDAMNKGVKHSKGEWILFLGADDYLLPGFSEMARDLNDPMAIYYGCTLWGNQILNRVPYTSEILPYECICHQGIFYPRAVFEKYSYNEKYVASADYHLNILCWTDNSFRKNFNPLLVANFSKGGFSEQVVDTVFKEDFPAILKDRIKLKTYLKYKYVEYKTQKKKLNGR